MLNIYIDVIPDSELNEVQMNNLKLARAICGSMGVYNVRAARIYPGDHRNIVGVYSVNKQAIYISPIQLMRARDTVDTVIHELAHHVSKAQDNTDKYKESLKIVADDTIMRCEAGMYDRVLTHVNW